MTVGVAVLGSGNIGTDLMIKVLRLSESLRMVAMAGIDPASDGLARARRLGVTTTAEGVDGLVALPEFADVQLVFDATSAGAHKRHDEVLRAHGRTVVDLTPAAIGPYVVPPVNLDEHLGEPNVNMVTCGGQATVPIVHAVGRVTPSRTARSSPRSPRSRPGPAPGPTSTSSPRPPPAPSRWSAAPSAARPSSC